jgi:hypothetical protein
MYVAEGPTYDNQGNLYFSPYNPTEDVSLVSLDRETGKRRWIIPGRGAGGGAPLILNDPDHPGEQLIYHGTYTQVMALRPDGTAVWSVPSGLQLPARREGERDFTHVWGMNYQPQTDAVFGVTDVGIHAGGILDRLAPDGAGVRIAGRRDERLQRVFGVPQVEVRPGHLVARERRHRRLRIRQHLLVEGQRIVHLAGVEVVLAEREERVGHMRGRREVLDERLVRVPCVVALPELLRGYVAMQQIMFGAILFATMAFLPGGLIEVGQRLRRMLLRGTGARVERDAALPSAVPGQT